LTDARHAAHEPVDVVVIGGGPAGAAAGRLLAEWGRSVLVLARPTPHGALAESIPPSCRKLLDRIGITGDIDAAGFVRATGNTVWWGGESRSANFPAGAYGYQVARDAFDALLLDGAARAGASVPGASTVRAVDGDADGAGWTVRYESGAAARRVGARWVLDCSGRAGVVAARRGWRRAERGRRTLALIAIWERAGGWRVDDETHTVVESYGDGWAWSVPLSRTRRCFAVMIDPALTDVSGGRALGTSYTAELGKAVRCAALVREAACSRAPWACDASPYGAERVAEAGLLLVGDAASFVDPLSSFGVKKALASAWLAAVAAHTCLDDPTMTDAVLRFYEARERLMYETLQHRSAQLSRMAAADGHDFWLARGASDLTEDGAEPDASALRRDPDVVRAFDLLKDSDSIALRPGVAAGRVQLPVVRGNRVTLAAHLVSPAYPHGIRYVRDIDLVLLADMAGGFRQVPDLYEAYNRAAPPVPLPDFLGALSLLLGKGLLQNA
jgi:flavin-dependent dehydrogenase